MRLAAEREVVIPIAEPGCLVGLGGSATVVRLRDGKRYSCRRAAVVVPAECGYVMVAD